MALVPPVATIDSRVHLLARTAIALSAVVYIGMRAVLVPMTYDEATSYVNYVNAPLLDIFDFSTAANHWLNSVLTRLSALVFGGAPWALRLPNVMAGALYVLCCARLVRHAPSGTIGTASLVIMVSNPYLLDYFALSRGYGLTASLMFASCLALSRWWADPLVQPRCLVLALALAGLATIASFGSLIGYLAVALVALVRLAGVYRSASGGEASVQDVIHLQSLMPGRRMLTCWVIASVVFTGEVLSRTQILDENHAAVTRVDIAGLPAAEAAKTSIYQLDATGRPRRMRPSGSNSWSAIDGRNVQSIRVVLPRATGVDIDSIAVTSGATRYPSSLASSADWLIDDVGEVRDLRTATRLRWSAPPQQRRMAYGYAVGVVSALTLAWGSLAALLRRVLRVAPAMAVALRSILAATFWLVPFVAAPLYLLRRDGQLFYGGTAGVFHDTVGSLIAGSLHDAVPAELAGRPALSAAVLVSWFCVSLVSHLRGRRPQAGAFVTALLAAIVLAESAILHRVFGVPYPLGRTALFLLPLLLSMPLSAACQFAHGRHGRRIATTCAVALATVCAWQFARSANVEYARDWPHDEVAADAVRLVLKHGEARPSPIRLGVEWEHYPPLAYYAQSLPAASHRLRVMVVPGEPLPVDYAYVPRDADHHLPELLQHYPESNAKLTTRPISSLPAVIR